MEINLDKLLKECESGLPYITANFTVTTVLAFLVGFITIYFLIKSMKLKNKSFFVLILTLVLLGVACTFFTVLL